MQIVKGSPPEVFLGQGALKICRNATGVQKLTSNFIEIALRHGCSTVNLLHIFGTSFPRARLKGCIYIVDYSL